MPPINDNFADATVLSGASGTISGSNIDATAETGEPDRFQANHYGGNGPQHSIWYRWTAPTSTIVQFDTVGSTLNSILTVFTGATIESLVAITQGARNGGGEDNIDAVVQFNAVAGTIYHLRIDGWYGSSPEPYSVGSVTLNWVGVTVPPGIGNDPTDPNLPDDEYRVTGRTVINNFDDPDYEDLYGMSICAPFDTYPDDTDDRFVIATGGNRGSGDYDNEISLRVVQRNPSYSESNYATLTRVRVDGPPNEVDEEWVPIADYPGGGVIAWIASPNGVDPEEVRVRTFSCNPTTSAITLGPIYSVPDSGNGSDLQFVTTSQSITGYDFAATLMILTNVSFVLVPMAVSLSGTIEFGQATAPSIYANDIPTLVGPPASQDNRGMFAHPIIAYPTREFNDPGDPLAGATSSFKGRLFSVTYDALAAPGNRVVINYGSEYTLYEWITLPGEYPSSIGFVRGGTVLRGVPTATSVGQSRYLFGYGDAGQHILFVVKAEYTNFDPATPDGVLSVGPSLDIDRDNTFGYYSWAKEGLTCHDDPSILWDYAVCSFSSFDEWSLNFVMYYDDTLTELQSLNNLAALPSTLPSNVITDRYDRGDGQNIGIARRRFNSLSNRPRHLGVIWQEYGSLGIDGNSYGISELLSVDSPLAPVVPCTPPANDNWANAQVLIGNSGSVIGTTECATLELDEPETACSATP